MGKKVLPGLSTGEGFGQSIAWAVHESTCQGSLAEGDVLGRAQQD